MIEERRGFLKKLAGATAVAGAGAVVAVAGESKKAQSSGGVVVGKSTKKEIIYKKNETWDEYYSAAL
ncbi:MAG: twin-arginine translocation signal domain-containing protein [Sulfurovum sp.]|nr:twin-arginine translocation signal domain-containing protein [Sulfurovum sp.]